MKDKTIFSHPRIRIKISDKSHGSVTAMDTTSFNKFFDDVQINKGKKFFMSQVHGNKVVWINNNSPKVILDCDSLITQEKHIYLTVVTADCLPVIMYDQDKQVTSVTHAGYKGLLKGVIEKTVKKYIDLGSDANKILVGVGPGIGVCCYKVNQERVKLFCENFPFLKNFYNSYLGDYYLDLKKILMQILIYKGINESNFFDLSVCTSCRNDKYYSYRKENARNQGRFATVVSLI